MKKILLLIALLLQIFNGFSQTIQYVDNDAPDRDSTEAETLPWFGNNQYLSNLLDSIGYNNSTANRIVTADIAKYKVPIKFWVYRRSDGSGGANLRNLRNYIDNLNRVFNVDNRTLIGFYLRCDIGFINSDDNFDIGGDGEAWNLIQNNKSRGCINIHIVGDYTAAGVHIRSRFFGRDGIILNFASTGGGASTTIAHEVGHYFELDHTHQYSSRGKCRKESVDRNRTWPAFRFCPFGGGGPSNQRICEATGDFLGDTPADPNLDDNLFNTAIPGLCSFNAQGNFNSTNDPWGDSYVNPPVGSSQPNPRNVMSYNRDRDCRINFSRLQIAVMLYSIERGKSKSNCVAWKDLKGEYDDLEMDNFSEAARPVNIGIIQEHNFHQQYEGDGNWAQCDVDWVSFVAPCNSTLNITTSAIQGRLNANTRLTLFNNTLGQLAQNDNISAANLFSNIDWNFVAGQEYFIRIENMAPNATSYYSLLIGNTFELTGSSVVCASSNGNLIISNLPTNATVIWSAVPNNRVTITPIGNGSSATLTRVSDGSVVITATITQACYGTFNLSKSMYVGMPYFGATYKDGRVDGNPVAIYFPNQGSNNLFNNVCIGYNGVPNVYIDGQPTGTNTINWSVPNGYATTAFSLYTGYGNRAYFAWNYGGTTPPGYIQASVSNGCGTYSQIFAFKQVNCGTPGGDPCSNAKGVNYYTISPNPASDIINIGVSNKPPPVNCNGLKAISGNDGIIFSQVNIYNNLGTLIKAYKTINTKTASIQVGNLITGIYTVEIIQADYIEKQQLIIQK
jgi:hypothetical protein